MENVEYLGFLIEVVSSKEGTYEYSVFDMTGKDKPEFPLFETEDVGFVSYETAVDDAQSYIRDFLLDGERAAEHIEKLYATKKALISSLSAETTGEVLQRLTVNVFNRPDCPDWARYAAVNADGKAVLFSDEPSRVNDRWGVIWHSTPPQAATLADGPFDASDWKNSLVERPALQRLTVNVFNRPDCPKWANYAVVNSRGTLIFFGNKPCFEGEDYGCWSCSDYEYKHIKDAVFDATDWPNSLIERPNKLPDWCKVDATGWHKRCGYFKVTYIDDVSKSVNIQQVEDKSKGYLSFHTVCNETRQARLRPYNEDEMRALVGKPINNASCTLLVTVYNSFKQAVKINEVWMTADQLFSGEGTVSGYTVDGKPCVIFEHLNDAGEWVE